MYNSEARSEWAKCSSSLGGDTCFTEDIQDGEYTVSFKLNCRGAKSEEAVFNVIVDQGLPDIVFVPGEEHVVDKWIAFTPRLKNGEDAPYNGWSVSPSQEENVGTRELDRSDSTVHKSATRTRFSVSAPGKYTVTVESPRGNTRARSVLVGERANVGGGGVVTSLAARQTSETLSSCPRALWMTSSLRTRTPPPSSSQATLPGLSPGPSRTQT